MLFPPAPRVRRGLSSDTDGRARIYGLRRPRSRRLSQYVYASLVCFIACSPKQTERRRYPRVTSFPCYIRFPVFSVLPCIPLAAAAATATATLPPPPSTPSFSPSSRSRNELNGVRPKERLDQEKQDIDSYRGKPVFPFSSFSFLSPFFLFSFLSFLRTFLLSFFLSSSPSFLLFFFRCPLLQPLYESESILDPPFLSPVAATYLPQDAARIYWPRRSHLSISPPLKSLQINPVD